MSRPLRPAHVGTRHTVSDAIWHLRQARDLLKVADCPRTLDRVRRAITSAGGAERHASRREGSTR